MAEPNTVWTPFDSALPILLTEYTFGPGFSSSIAVRGEQGMIVVSPPWRPSPAAFDEVADHGEVRALVEPNAFHTMGVAEWKARFPRAEVFAPPQSIARIAKKTGVTPRPLGEVGPIAGPRVQFVDIPHYKTGEALLRIESARGVVWFVTDIVFNMRELPANPVAKLVLGLSRSAPGLRFNNIAALFMMKDKRAVKSWLAGEFLKQKPRWIIPAHGAPVDVEAQIADVRAMLELS